VLTIKRASPLGFILVAIVVAEVIVLMPSRRIDESQPASFATPPQEVNLSIVGFHAVNLDSEGRRGTVDAKEAQIYKEKGFALLKDVDAKIYTRGDNTIRIRAQEGKYYLEKKDIEFLLHEIEHDLFQLLFRKLPVGHTNGGLRNNFFQFFYFKSSSSVFSYEFFGFF